MSKILVQNKQFGYNSLFELLKTITHCILYFLGLVAYIPAKGWDLGLFKLLKKSHECSSLLTTDQGTKKKKVHGQPYFVAVFSIQRRLQINPNISLNLWPLITVVLGFSFSSEKLKKFTHGCPFPDLTNLRRI